MGARCMLLLLVVLTVGCGGVDPSSSRSLDILLYGRWTAQHNPDDGPPPYIQFGPDGVFAAPLGTLDIYARNLTGPYWRVGDYVGFKAIGEGRDGLVYVKFMKAEVIEFPRLKLTLTAIQDAYVAEMMGANKISELKATQIQDALRRLNQSDPLPVALGSMEDYYK